MERLYGALAPSEVSLDKQDAALVDRLIEARANDESAVAEAVKDILLPHLPDSARSVGDLPSYTLFLAIDGVAKLLTRQGRVGRTKNFVVRSSGDVAVEGGRVVIPATTMAREVVRTAKVAGEEADKLVRWMVTAGRSQPHLFLGMVVDPCDERDLSIELMRRDNTQDVAAWWKEGLAESDAAVRWQWAAFR
jgi:hypothetical protein